MFHPFILVVLVLSPVIQSAPTDKVESASAVDKDESVTTTINLSGLDVIPNDVPDLYRGHDFASYQPFDFPTHKPFDFPTYKPFDFTRHKPFNFPTYKPLDFTTHNLIDFPSYKPYEFPSYQPYEFPPYEPYAFPPYKPYEFPSHQPYDFPPYEPYEFPSYKPYEFPPYKPYEFPSQKPLVFPLYKPLELPSYGGYGPISYDQTSSRAFEDTFNGGYDSPLSEESADSPIWRREFSSSGKFGPFSHNTSGLSYFKVSGPPNDEQASTSNEGVTVIPTEQNPSSSSRTLGPYSFKAGGSAQFKYHL